MSIELLALPYKEEALSPHISKETIGLHYSKHHAGYVNRLNAEIEGTPLESLDLEEMITQSSGKSDLKLIFNNAAQIWNHTFYWESMSPDGGGEPPQGQLLEMLEASFGSTDKFREEFFAKAVGHFGSGWVWLVHNGDGLEIITTSNAELPLTAGLKALLTLDVWEHAYYLDYKNVRPDYVKRWQEELVNWEFASNQLAI